MIAGTAFANELAACTSFLPEELHTAERATYGFVFRHILGACMHCALWTRLDILTACLTLAQYQAQPGDLHFKALKHIVGYLRLHPDLPLTFQRSTVSKDLASINFELLEPDLVSQVNSLNIEIIPSNFNVPVNSDPTAFTSCDNLFQTFGDTLQDADRPSSFSPANVSRLAPPVTECLVDANLPGGLYERMATTGGSIEMGGTTVIHVCKKQDTMAENSTEAEIDAAAFLGKILRWLVLFMSDIGLPFQSPIPIAEDNSATRIIAHSGKVTRNVRHVAIKTLALQGLVRNKIAIFNAIGTAYNRADHFTKPLALIAFRDHITMMMGLRFLTKLHAALTAERNREDFSGK